MKGIDNTSTAVLKEAADILCGNDEKRREFLQAVYDLGVNDGQLKYVRERMEKAA